MRLITLGALIDHFYVVIKANDKSIVMGWGSFNSDIEAESFAYNKLVELNGKLHEGQYILVASESDVYPENPFDQGYFVRESNLPKTINNSSVGTIHFSEWVRGWEQANEIHFEIMNESRQK